MAAITAHPEGKYCNVSSLFLADSDGADWETFAGPLLAPGQGWDSQEIYRSSLLYDPTTTRLRLWYSAQGAASLAWHVGYTEGLVPLP
jgi:hypothetical protein